MGRDWTPQEQYLIALNLQNKEKDLKSFMKNKFDIVFIKADTKEKIPLYSEEEKKVLLMFEFLGFLFSDNLYNLWEKTSKYPICRKKFLDETEKEIEAIIKADRNNKNLSCFDKTIVQWYLGKLDNNFYYSEENNKLFEEYLYKKILKNKNKENCH